MLPTPPTTTVIKLWTIYSEPNSDVTLEKRNDGSTRYKPKTISEPIWVVSIDMPRRYVDEFTPDVVEVDSQFVDMEDADLNSQNQASSINKTVPNTGIL